MAINRKTMVKLVAAGSLAFLIGQESKVFGEAKDTDGNPVVLTTDMGDIDMDATTVGDFKDVIVPDFNTISNKAMSAVQPEEVPPAVSNVVTKSFLESRGMATTNYVDSAATLTPIYEGGSKYSDWICDPATVTYNEVTYTLYVYYKMDAGTPKWFLSETLGSAYPIDKLPYDADATTLTFSLPSGWSASEVTSTRTSTAIVGYTLGDQIDKPLQSKGDYATTNALASAISVVEATNTVQNTRLDTLETQITNKLDKSGGTLTPVYGGNGEKYSSWAIDTQFSIVLKLESGKWVPYYYDNVYTLYGEPKGDVDSTTLSWTQGVDASATFTATRTANPIIGYTLGTQTDKPLQPKGDYATTNDLADIVSCSQYFPDGSVKNPNELTSGIKYTFVSNATERTATVNPFSNMEPDYDNSSLVGRVVIPPFVDAQGNPFVSDDGTRYTVVGIGSGGGLQNNTNLTAIVAPITLTQIDKSAVDFSTVLTNLSFPGVQSVGGYAFVYDRALTSISFPAAESLATEALAYCSALTSVSLPAVQEIGDEVFLSCTSLVSVVFGDTPRTTVPTLGEDAFLNVPSSCKIVVPDAQYDAWIAAPGWSTLVTQGFSFIKYSKWEYARKYEIPDVPSWAMQPNKPSYTATEVGAYSTNTVDSLLAAKASTNDLNTVSNNLAQAISDVHDIATNSYTKAETDALLPGNYSAVSNAAMTVKEKLDDRSLMGYGWPFSDWTNNHPELNLTSPVFTKFKNGSEVLYTWKYTVTNSTGEVVGNPHYIPSSYEGIEDLVLNSYLDGTNIVFQRTGTPVYTNALGVATLENLEPYVKHSQMDAALVDYVTNETLENYDASYKIVEGISTENQTIQLVVYTNSTPQNLEIQLPANGRCKDWIVYVLSYEVDMPLVLPPADYWIRNYNITNSIAAGTPTALYFSQVSPEGVYTIGRQEYIPLTVESSRQYKIRELMKKMTKGARRGVPRSRAYLPPKPPAVTNKNSKVEVKK